MSTPTFVLGAAQAPGLMTRQDEPAVAGPASLIVVDPNSHRIPG